MPSIYKGFNRWNKRARMDHSDSEADAANSQHHQREDVQRVEDIYDLDMIGEAVQNKYSQLLIEISHEDDAELAALSSDDDNEEEAEDAALSSDDEEAEDAALSSDEDAAGIAGAPHNVDLDEPGLGEQNDWSDYSDNDQGYDEDTEGSNQDDWDYELDSMSSCDQGYDDSLADSGDSDCNCDTDESNGDYSSSDSEDSSSEDGDEAVVNYAEWSGQLLYPGARHTCGQMAVELARLVRKHASLRRGLLDLLRLICSALPTGHRMFQTERQLWTLARLDAGQPNPHAV